MNSLINHNYLDTSTGMLSFLLLTSLLLDSLINPIEGSTITTGTINSRTTRSNLENLASLAFEHGVKIREFGSCRTPKPEIVYVNSNNPSKVYLPRGTILHRCSDSTGCCPQAFQSCRPISTEMVELYFFTVTLVANSSSSPSSSSTSSSYSSSSSSSNYNHHHRHHNKKPRQQQNIEKLTYVNHTKCACVDLNSSDDESFNNEI
ncbi:uncharacterized protein LOC128388736 [Panonychus citri]|uniref:uncharacterized protein LOC128388736 n=1 Tax=Panonychus citri TaxID=50023 RepID=UPI002307F4EB|nr:uncharacterized protein LOC128388736 [Panonychus citri]